MALDSAPDDDPARAAADYTLLNQRRIAQLSAVLVRNLSIRDTRPSHPSPQPTRTADRHDDDSIRDRRLDGGAGAGALNGIRPLSTTRSTTPLAQSQITSGAEARNVAGVPSRPTGAFRRSASAGTLLERTPGSSRSSRRVLNATVGEADTIAEEAPAPSEGTPSLAAPSQPDARHPAVKPAREPALSRPRTRSQSEADRRRTALHDRLVDCFVSLHLLPPAAAATTFPSSSSEPTRTAPSAGEVSFPDRRHAHGRSRSGSVRSVFARPSGSGQGGSAPGPAPGLSRSGSAHSVHKVDTATIGASAFATSPRKTMRRRTTVSADFFAPLPSFPSHTAKSPSSTLFPASPVAAALAPPPAPVRPFFVSDLSKAATHATFFLDPEQITVPSWSSASSETPSDPTAGLPAFPEQVRDWPGWTESRIQATVWARPTAVDEVEGDSRSTRASEDGGKGKAKATGDEDDWRVVAEWEVDLAGLTSLGRDPTEFPTLPPNTLVFAMSSSGVVPQFPSDPSTSSAAATDELEYFTAPIPLLERAHRRRLRAERRARTTAASTRFDSSSSGSSLPLLQQRSWSEDELSDYLEECCDDSECSDCGADGEFGDAVPFRGSDEEVGGGAGYTSDPGLGADGAVVRRPRSDTIRSRRSGRSGARRGTLTAHDRAQSGSTTAPGTTRSSGQRSRPPPSHATTTTTTGRIEPAEHVRRRKRREAQEVLEKSRRETRMVHAAGWEGIRKLCEARWELEGLKREVADRRETVAREMGDEEEGWSAQDRLRAELRDRLEDLEGVKEAVDSELSEEQYELDIRRARLRQRRDRLDRAQILDLEHGEALNEVQRELHAAAETHAELALSAQTRRTQLITLLSHIFPIEPVFSAPKGISPDLLFSILGIPLPNSTFPSSYSDDAVSSALGYAAQVTQLIAAYLSVPLCYPITSCGSRSTVRDEISMMKGPRAFPLFGKGVDQYRFDYGVFLLNKNIEQLMYAQGLTVLDLRNTLPNLKTLILSLSYDPSHDDFLASTLLPTGPFAADEEDDRQPPDHSVPEGDAFPTEHSGPEAAHPYDEEAERATVTTTRSSRSTSNASTIRPSKLLVSTHGQREAGVPATEASAPLPSEVAPPDLDPLSISAAGDSSPKGDVTPRKSRRNGRRRSSSSASEKVTLVKTVHKAHGRSPSGGSPASSGSGHASGGGGGGGGGYGAKLREGLWSVVAGGTGRRESSASATENGPQGSGPVGVE